MRDVVKGIAIAALMGVIAWAGFLFGQWLVAPEPPVRELPDNMRIEEDDPRWDCERHGNGLCGPIDADPAQPRVFNV